MRTSTLTPTDRAHETVIAVSADARGRMRSTLRSGLLAPRLLGTAADGRVRIGLVATGATLLGGDAVSVRVEVGADCRVELVDVAGTVAYDGRGEAASFDVEVRVGPRAVLCWNCAPFVASGGARPVRRTDAEVAAGGRLLLRDTLVLGRTGEPPGTIDCRTRMWVEGRPAVAEDLALRADAGAAPGVLGGRRVLDTVTAVGWRPEPVDDVPHLTLAARGAIGRELVRDAHSSRCDWVYRAWEAEALSPRAPEPVAVADTRPAPAGSALGSGSW